MGRSLLKYSYSLTQKSPVLERHLYKYEKTYEQGYSLQDCLQSWKIGGKNQVSVSKAFVK